MFVTLPGNSSITYEVEITNKSNTIYTLSSLNELSSLNSNLTYTIDTEQYDIYDSNSIRKVTIIISNNINDEISDSLVIEYMFNKAYSMFINGRSFNAKIKTLAGNTDVTHNTKDSNITSVIRSSTLNTSITEDNIVSTSDSTVPIYVWYDEGIIYYYTKYDNPMMNYDASYMFNELQNVVYLDIENFDSSKVTSFERMFCACYKLKSLNLNKWNTSNVTILRHTFAATGLTNLEIEEWNVCNVTDMRALFQSTSLKTMDLSKWNTKSLTVSAYMFMDTKIENLVLGKNFNTSNVREFKHMFKDSYIISLDISMFDMSNAVEVTNMITNMIYLQELKTPKAYPTNTSLTISLPKTLYDDNDNEYTILDSTSPTETWLKIE